MAGEQRKFQRVPQNLHSELDGGLGGERSARTIRITDLSAGGIGFESSIPLFVGEIVEFEIPLAHPIRATAQVIWSVTSTEPRKYGAIFFWVRSESVLTSRRT